MKTQIEENAKKFKIRVNGKFIELKSILTGSCKVSSAIKVCLNITPLCIYFVF